MPGRLIVMRHAKSAWPAGIADFDRPLAPRGEAAAEMLGRWLQRQGFRPDRALVSPARRTRETWARMAPFFPDLAPRFEPDIYNASAADLLELLQSGAAGGELVLLLGHNPGMQELAYGLADPALSDPDALIRLSQKYPTAGVAVLEGFGDAGHPSSGSMRLSAFITPRILGGVDED